MQNINTGLLDSIAEYFQDNQDDYNLFRCKVEKKMVANNICEYDLYVMLEVDQRNINHLENIENENNAVLKRYALDGDAAARYRLGVRLLWEYRQWHEVSKFLIGFALLCLSNTLWDCKQYIRDNFDDDVLKATMSKGFTVEHMFILARTCMNRVHW